MALVLELATQDDNTLLWPNPGDLPAAQCLQIAKGMGATWIRFNIFSSYLDRFGWDPYNAAVDRAMDAGMNVQVTISGQPRWDVVNPDGSVPFLDPTPEAFANFSRYVVENLKDRVRRFSLFNEPNHPAFLQSTKVNTADLYGSLYRTSYEAVRKVDRECEILFGELSGREGARAFLSRAVRDHVTYASGIAVHPYQYLTNPSKPDPGDNFQWGHLPLLQRHLRSLHVRGEFMTRAQKPVPVYVTEFGYFCHGEKRGIPESRRAAYVATTIQQARKWGLRQYLYYHLVEAPGAPWNSGIVHIDGSTTDTYKEIATRFK